MVLVRILILIFVVVFVTSLELKCKGVDRPNDCKLCICENGRWVCPLKGCNNTPVPSHIANKRDLAVAPDLRNTPCAPNDYFKIDCNTCYCNLDQSGYLCTENICLGNENFKPLPSRQKVGPGGDLEKTDLGKIIGADNVNEKGFPPMIDGANEIRLLAATAPTVPTVALTTRFTETSTSTTTTVGTKSTSLTKAAEPASTVSTAASSSTSEIDDVSSATPKVDEEQNTSITIDDNSALTNRTSKTGDANVDVSDTKSKTNEDHDTVGTEPNQAGAKTVDLGVNDSKPIPAEEENTTNTTAKI